MEPIEQLSVIVPAVCDVVDRIPFSKLGDPTPCDKFAVHDVLNHMIVLGSTFAGLFRGEEPTAIEPPFVYGWVPASEFRASMVGLLDAVKSPGAMERTIPTPMGPLSGDTFARFVAFDGLVHGWDLATATGLSYEIPESLVGEVHAFARHAIAAEMRDGETFKNEIDPPTDASPLQQLAAFSGRAV